MDDVAAWFYGAAYSPFEVVGALSFLWLIRQGIDAAKARHKRRRNADR